MLSNQSFRSDESTSSHSPRGQTLYLVFESALLSLFSLCIYCGSLTSISKVVIGSFLKITQTCSRCSRRRVWESQPYVGKIPAGNILTSASILYAGALPIQVLKMFRYMNLATITRKTFFRHQNKFLQPAVLSVWNHHHELLISSLNEKGDKLITAGDGRSDSPGHSAKYGSYSLLKLTVNKIVDFKLIQVHACTDGRIIIYMYKHLILLWHVPL